MKSQFVAALILLISLTEAFPLGTPAGLGYYNNYAHPGDYLDQSMLYGGYGGYGAGYPGYAGYGAGLGGYGAGLGGYGAGLGGYGAGLGGYGAAPYAPGAPLGGAPYGGGPLGGAYGAGPLGGAPYGAGPVGALGALGAPGAAPYAGANGALPYGSDYISPDGQWPRYNGLGLINQYGSFLGKKK